MRIAVGHVNPDFDAYAATVAATRLFEATRGVFLGTQNANVRAFHNLHEEFLSFVDLRGLDLSAITEVVMVDTRDPDRIGELKDVVLDPAVEVVVYDHHPAQEGDIVPAVDHSLDVGATTSILVHEMKRRGLEPTPLEASLYLLGIHEDTGSLTYPNSTAYDADAAAWLMSVGADLEVVNRYLTRSLDPEQRVLLAELERSLELWDVNGQQIAVGVAHAEEYVDSASVLTHYVVEDMGFRVAIGIVQMPERLQIVARSRIAEVDVGAVMGRLGGGGHAQAASAGFRDLTVDDALARVREALRAEVSPPVRAVDIMSSPVRTVSPESTMGEAGELMSRWGHGGLPVMDDGSLAGIITRKDVDKALRHELEHAPVKGFIGKGVVTVGPDADLSDLERLLATRGIGRVPVVSGGVLIGIVTRKDVLRASHGQAYLDKSRAQPHPEATEAFLSGVETLLPDEAREALHRLGDLAERMGLRVHVVGGFVRDMVLGRPNLDVDLVVEGDGVAFGQRAGEELGIRVRVHRRFGTAVLVFSRDLHVDIASSRAEYYARPGALPTVERSSLRQDLFRRDFTINAMAACIDPDCFGAIADPYGGLADLRAGAVRVLHALSFIDDPTRILRAARFEVRYGFALDPVSEHLAAQAARMGLLDEISGARVREEIDDLLREEDPASVISRLDTLGAAAALVPEGSGPPRAREAMTGALEARARLRAIGAGRVGSRRTALLAALAASGTPQGAERWIRHFRIGHDDATVIRAVAASAGAGRALSDRRGMRDSRLAGLLSQLPPEAVVNLWARGDELARSRIERFARDLAAIRPAVSGRDLIALGAEPGAGFSAILARARDDRLDGRAVGREAELANLRRLAVHAGLIPTGRTRA